MSSCSDSVHVPPSIYPVQDIQENTIHDSSDNKVELEQHSISWMTDEEQALNRAKQLQTRVIVLICAAWSTGCLEMDRTLWKDARVYKHVGGTVMLRIDVTSAAGNAELYASKYDVRTIPELLVLDMEGHLLFRHSGVISVEQFLSEVSP